MVMLFEVMQHIKNYFPACEGKVGTYVVENNTINLPFLLNGQYFIIEGSVFNDGVHQYPATDLIDETFMGVITPCAIPKTFLSLVEEIEAYQANNVVSPYVSESFGGYSYTKATGRNGNAASWADAFGTRLNAYRKI